MTSPCHTEGVSPNPPGESTDRTVPGSANPAGFRSIRLDREDGIATIILNRPDRLNAFTVRMAAELLAAFDATDADPDVRVVIVTGEGRAFCAGADLGGGENTFGNDAKATASAAAELPAPETGDHPDAVRDTGGMVALRVFNSLKPVIAAINGPAVGVGATMTLPMDLRLASDTARIGFPFAARGIVPEACSSWFLPRLVGVSRAIEWCTLNRLIPAREAASAGLIRSVHPPDELLGAARELATQLIHDAAPVSVTLTRHLMWRMLGEPHPMAAHRIDSRAVSHTGRSPDAAEGIMSFLERRDPRWQGQVPADLPDWFPWWDEPGFS